MNSNDESSNSKWIVWEQRGWDRTLFEPHLVSSVEELGEVIRDLEASNRKWVATSPITVKIIVEPQPATEFPELLIPPAVAEQLEKTTV